MYILYIIGGIVIVIVMVTKAKSMKSNYVYYSNYKQNKHRTRKRIRNRRLQRGGFDKGILHMVANENPLYTYGKYIGNTHGNIDQMYATMDFTETQESLQDGRNTVDAWLASIILFGRMMDKDKMKSKQPIAKPYSKTIIVKNVRP